jgi:hypothetical protein
MAPLTTQFQVRPPSIFTARAVLMVCAYGLLLLIPVLIAMMIVSVLRFGLWTFLIPFGAICGATYFLPFGFGNAHISGLLRRRPNPHPGEPAGWPVQLTCSPRLRLGLRALLEDADDIGHLTVTESGLVFEGDSIRLTLPWRCILGLRAQSIGWRGLFVYPRLVLTVSEISGLKELRFADRSAWVLPTARKRTRELYRRLVEMSAP